MMTADLLDVSTHFRFGENWSNYADLVDERRIGDAVDSVRALVGDLSGKTFLDIGSGSGLFSVAALRLGASEVVACDIDADSVATTRRLLSGEERKDWRAEQMSVFDVPSRIAQRFDVVYSWGVLHHTGDMWRAIDRAASMVAPGGQFALALYERTLLCGAWTLEKRIYRKLPRPLQAMLRGLYLGVWGAGMLLKRKNPLRHMREGHERGMDIAHDVHDWMGGYPYESTTPAAVDAFLEQRGFDRQKLVPWPVRVSGLLGSGCTEYVYRRTSA